MTTTLLRCVHCGHERTLYRQAGGQHYYDLGGAAILCCARCHGGAFRLVSEADPQYVRPATISYAYGSLGEYADDADAADVDFRFEMGTNARGEFVEVSLVAGHHRHH